MRIKLPTKFSDKIFNLSLDIDLNLGHRKEKVSIQTDTWTFGLNDEPVRLCLQRLDLLREKKHSRYSTGTLILSTLYIKKNT